MNDPVLLKLKADAGIVLADLWRMLRHQPPVEVAEWRLPRVASTPTEAVRKEPGRGGPRHTGLCYFHLN